APVENEPRGERPAAFQSETLSWFEPLITRIFSPSKAAATGDARPKPVSVARTAPVAALTTDKVESPEDGTHRLVPSKTGSSGARPTGTVWRTWPALPSRRRVAGEVSVTQTFAPANRTPSRTLKPAVTVVTVQGSAACGVTMATPESPITQIRPPSAASSPGKLMPRSPMTSVAPPGGRLGSIRKSFAGNVEPGTRIPCGETAAAVAAGIPVQVSSSRPSLARTPPTPAADRLTAQTSVPSHAGSCAPPAPSVVRPRAPDDWVVQDWPRIARARPRGRTRSPLRERKAAI